MSTIAANQVDLGAFGAHGMADAEARAREYRLQLNGIENGRLRSRFLEYIAQFDPVARRLMKI